MQTTEGATPRGLPSSLAPRVVHIFVPYSGLRRSGLTPPPHSRTLPALELRHVPIPCRCHPPPPAGATPLSSVGTTLHSLLPSPHLRNLPQFLPNQVTNNHFQGLCPSERALFPSLCTSPPESGSVSLTSHWGLVAFLRPCLLLISSNRRTTRPVGLTSASGLASLQP